MSRQCCSRVTLVFTLLGLAAWGLTRQLQHLAADVPGYRANIRAKIADVRGAGKGGTVEQLQETIEDLKGDLGASTPPPGPLRVRSSWLRRPLRGSPASAGWGRSSVRSGTAGLVLALVMFMLLERRDLRDRLIGLFGQGRLAITTKAFDEAGTPRQPAAADAVARESSSTGSASPSASTSSACRIPSCGRRSARRSASFRTSGRCSARARPSWSAWRRSRAGRDRCMVVALFVALELFTNLVLETVLYAGAAGVSQVALLVSVAFWTWLWGPLGLLLATPLTVCLVVLGKHVPGLEFLGTLMADRPALAPEYNYYQRLLARDQSEAADLVERYIKQNPPSSVYDALLLPALNYAERDRLEGRLSGRRSPR